MSASILEPDTVYYQSPGTIKLILNVDIFGGDTFTLDYQTLTVQVSEFAIGQTYIYIYIYRERDR